MTSELHEEPPHSGDFYLRLKDAVRLKDFAIEYGCNIPPAALETINGLAVRAGLMRFKGLEMLSDEGTLISAPEITALDEAIMSLNAATCPTTLSIISRPPDPVLLDYFTKGLPLELAQTQDERRRERFYWIVGLTILFDAFVFQGMNTWIAPLILAALQGVGLAVFGGRSIREMIEVIWRSHRNP